MITKSITISKNPADGQSPVALFVQVASKFESRILVQTGNKTVNAKSIMGVMTLNFSQGAEMEVSAEGADEDAAIQGISGLLCGN
ncbi:MAG: HPr family phosphocarrier protein [Lachnospiraceae bacterium]|nr:HPr family phosphocarrier protein [Lachnospiraceae bacterium]